MILRFNDHTVLVSPQGGSVLAWMWRDQYILGPPVMKIGEPTGADSFSLKMRGITHWCWPFHGNAPATGPYQGMPKHGGFRDLLLTPTNFNGQEVFFFGQDSGKVQFCSSVSLHGAGPRGSAWLAMKLVAIAHADEGSSLRLPVRPALHPYFSTGGNRDYAYARVGGKTVPAGPEASRVERRDPVMVEFPFGDVRIAPSANCSWYVLWTDDASKYMCAEPAFGGRPGTLDTSPPEMFLEPYQPVIVSVGLEFVPR